MAIDSQPSPQLKQKAGLMCSKNGRMVLTAYAVGRHVPTQRQHIKSRAVAASAVVDLTWDCGAAAAAAAAASFASLPLRQILH